MFEKEAEEYRKDLKSKFFLSEPQLDLACQGFKDGYNKANEWHYVKNGDLPKQDGHTCFSIEVLANNKKWVRYRFDNGKWFCGNKEVKVLAWKEIILPELKENE